MKKADKKSLLRLNVACWTVAILFPPLIKLIPTSHPPRILPLIIFLFWLALAFVSTHAISRTIGPPSDE